MKKKIVISKPADVQTALRIPSEDWEKIKELAKKKGTTPQTIIRFVLHQSLDEFE